MAGRTDTDSIEPAGFDGSITWEMYKDFLDLLLDYARDDELTTVSVPLTSSDNGEVVLYVDVEIPVNSRILTGADYYGPWMHHLRDQMNFVGETSPGGLPHQIAAWCYFCSTHIMHRFWSYLGIEDPVMLDIFTIPRDFGLEETELLACAEFENLSDRRQEIVLWAYFMSLQNFLEAGNTR